MPNGTLHHIEINVSNLQKTVQFWSWLLEELDYEPFQKWDGGKSWRLADTYIVFVQVEERFRKIPYHRKAVGLNHLAFHGKSKEHVDEIMRALEANGIPILYKDRHPYAGGPNHYAVFLEDPDRIKIEIVAP